MAKAFDIGGWVGGGGGEGGGGGGGHRRVMQGRGAWWWGQDNSDNRDGYHAQEHLGVRCTLGR